MSIANQGFPAFRADLNDALPALASNNAGAAEPSTMFAHQWWVDTSANPSVLKQRNADNDAWITFGTINQTGDTFSLVAESATLSGGTANGVTYLNGSKVLTSGSALTFDGANLGIGTSSPGARTHIVSAAGTPQLKWSDATNGTATLDTAAGLSRIYTNVGLAFGSGTESFTERARIDSSGNLLVGATSAGATNTNSINFNLAPGYGFNSHVNHINGTSSGVPYFSFNYNGNLIGSIAQNGTTGTSYNSTSDYRLKEDWQPMTGASERVQALKPVNFAWKVDGSRVDGFLAHEAQEVVPECVTGVKDAVDAEGKPNYQGIDQSKLVPLLTAALQEALTKIDALTARLDAANL
jgi:hypothetical protein